MQSTLISGQKSSILVTLTNIFRIKVNFSHRCENNVSISKIFFEQFDLKCHQMVTLEKKMHLLKCLNNFSYISSVEKRFYYIIRKLHKSIFISIFMLHLFKVQECEVSFAKTHKIEPLNGFVVVSLFRIVYFAIL